MATELLYKAEVYQIIGAAIEVYLRCTGFRVGLLINFGDPGRLDWTRLVH